MAPFLATHIILNLSSSVDVAHVPNEYSISNLCHFIHHGMVDYTSLIWSYYNLCRSLFVAWLTVSALYGSTVIFTVHSS